MRRPPAWLLWNAIAAGLILASGLAAGTLLPRLAPEWTARHASWRPLTPLRARAVIRFWGLRCATLATTAPPWPSLPRVSPPTIDSVLRGPGGEPLPVYLATVRSPASAGEAFVALLLLAERARWQDDAAIADAVALAAGSPHPGVRIQALLVQAGLGDPRALPDLLALAASGPPPFQRDAIRWLGAWGDRALLEWPGGRTGLEPVPPGTAGARAAVPILLRCLDDPDAAVRAEALEALARIGDETVAPAIIERLGAVEPTAATWSMLARWSDRRMSAALLLRRLMPPTP